MSGGSDEEGQQRAQVIRADLDALIRSTRLPEEDALIRSTRPSHSSSSSSSGTVGESILQWKRTRL